MARRCQGSAALSGVECQSIDITLFFGCAATISLGMLWSYGWKIQRPDNVRPFSGKGFTRHGSYLDHQGLPADDGQDLLPSAGLSRRAANLCLAGVRRGAGISRVA